MLLLGFTLLSRVTIALTKFTQCFQFDPVTFIYDFKICNNKTHTQKKTKIPKFIQTTNRQATRDPNHKYVFQLCFQ